MTALLPRRTAELVRMGKTQLPVGVMIRVARREDVELAASIAGDLLVFARGRLAKAALPGAIAARDARMAELAPELEAALVAYFDELLARAGVRKDVAFPLDPDSVDWKAEAKLLEKILEVFYLDLGEFAYAAVGEQLGLELSFSLEGAATASIRDRLATQVTSITDTTRDLLRDKVEDAVRDGLSIDDLVRGTDSAPGLEDLLGSRARTIALTETATAYNSAATAGYRESGLIDEVLVFDGPDCGWTEHDDGDLADGSTRTLDEADEYPVAHPHCVAPGTMIEPLGRATAAYRAVWSGPLVEVSTAGSVRMTVGPHHPVLTGRGWIAAEDLEVGDNVVRRLAHGSAAALPGHVDLDDRKPLAEDVFAALAQAFRHSSVVAAAADLHGDGAFVQGEIEVVGTERLLPREGHAASGEQLGELVLVGTGPELQPLPGARSSLLALGPVDADAAGRPGGFHVAGVAVLVPDGNATLAEPISEVAVADAGFVGEMLRRFACDVALDQVVKVRQVESVGGHVYDFETSARAYFANGIVVHNCQRAFGPVVAR